jgi:hypothetical protein
MDERKLYSTMDRVRGPVDTFYYGHDKEALYVAFEGDIARFDRRGLNCTLYSKRAGEHFVFDLEHP